MMNPISNFGNNVINALNTLTSTKKTESKSSFELKFEPDAKTASPEGMQQGTATAAASKSTVLQRLAARLNPTGAGKAMLNLADSLNSPVNPPNAFRLLFATKSAQKEYAAMVEGHAQRLINKSFEGADKGPWVLLAAKARHYQNI